MTTTTTAEVSSRKHILPAPSAQEGELGRVRETMGDKGTGMEKETGMGMGMERLPQTTMGIITPAASLIEEQRITIDRVKEERQLQLLREEQEEKGLLKEESAGSMPQWWWFTYDANWTVHSSTSPVEPHQTAS